jgi:hypothetical protein
MRTVRPDFVFFSEQPDGSIAAIVVDRHGPHLADALPKLRGMAAYAERYGDRYQRFEAVAKVETSCASSTSWRRACARPSSQPTTRPPFTSTTPSTTSEVAADSRRPGRGRHAGRLSAMRADP